MIDPLFFHRQAYAEQLVSSLKTGITHAFTLFAPRRMGKTQFLLQDVAPLAKAGGFNVFYFSFMDSENPAADFQAALYQFAQNIQAGGKIKTFLGGISKLEILGVGIERTSQETAMPRLSDLLHLIAADSRPSLLLLDEIQELARQSGTQGLIRSLRTGLDTNQTRIKTLFTGSSTNGLRAMFNDNKAPFFYFAHALDFPLLGKDFTDFLAGIYHDRTGQQIDQDELYRLFERLHHTPMYVRAIIQDMILSPSVSLADAAAARLEDLNAAHNEAGYWQKMKPLERVIIQDIARNPNPSPYSKESRRQYAERLGMDSVSNSSIQGAIRRMERHDWISKNSGGQLVINNPLLKTWIIEHTEHKTD